MTLLKMKEPECFLYSVAMLLEEDPDALREELMNEQHIDPVDIVFPDREKPYCYRGYHSQEITLLCLKHGIALITLEVDPIISSDGEDQYHIYDEHRGFAIIQQILQNQEALLWMPHHICAWDGKEVYDPNGYIYPLERLKGTLEGIMLASNLFLNREKSG